MKIDICRGWDLTDAEERTLPRKKASFRVYYLRITWDSGTTEVVSGHSSRAVARALQDAYDAGVIKGLSQHPVPLFIK